MYQDIKYKSRFKIASKGRVVLMVSAMLSCLSVVNAAPTGGVVTTGSATIASSGTTTNINQSTQKASINWQGFSIASNETVNFNQPSASSITLNRVVGNETSVIAGALNANGKVFILNSNGILFTQGSSVNTSGLVASTLNLSDEDFNKNNFVFQANGSQGSVINMGTITIANSGYAALLGKEVSNQGVIVATKGTVALSSGDKITLNFNGDSLMSVTIDEGTLNALVENKNAIYADGGKVILTAKAANDLLASQVNNEGLIQAQTLDDLKGEITLYAHGGTTTVDGKLDASAPTSGDGGFIETSGDKVKINDNAQILTKSTNGNNGTWLIDPVDFTIAASGGDMSGTLLSNYLNTQGSQTITSSTGSINVNDAISWDAASTLTLDAYNDINVNKTITGKYTAYDSSTPTTKAGLTLKAGHDININNAISLTNAALSMTYGNAYNIRTKASYSGAVLDANGNPIANTDTSGGVYGSVTFNGGVNSGDALSINNNNYTLIYSMSQLDMLDGYNAETSTGSAIALSNYYALAGNLDAAAKTYTSGLLGKSDSSAFTGTLTGLGHTISNLTMSTATDGVSYLGLIGYASGATLRDIGLVNVNINSQSYSDVGTGALVGNLDGGTVYNAYSTGTVTGYGSGGGLIGAIWNSTLSYAYSDADVTGSGAGGLAGYVNTVTASHVHATGEVAGSGGLFGGMLYGSLSYAYATGNVTAGGGGLIGSLALDITSSATMLYPVSYAFATGNVTGASKVGGLIGSISGGKSSNKYTIDHVYATGNVTATSTDPNDAGGGGGLIGYAGIAGSLTISNAHATGKVTVAGYADAGGLVGLLRATKGATLTDSYATGDVDAPNGMHVGGLVGSMTGGSSGSTISGSYATGNATGYDSVGGLVGTMGKGTITSSYATGKATATSASGVAGGIAGDARGTNIGSDVYYNSDTNAIGQAYTRDATGTDNSTGLKGDQVADAKYYVDGTITQVLANRAAAKAILDEHVANATQQIESIQSSTQKDTAEKIIPPVAENFLAQNTPPPLMQNITIIDPTYTASIKTIVIDGKTYVIEDDEEDKK